MSRVNRHRAKQNPSIVGGTIGARTGDAARTEPPMVGVASFSRLGTWDCFGF